MSTAPPAAVPLRPRLAVGLEDRPFLELPENRLALAAVRRLSAAPASRPANLPPARGRLVFLHGPSGCGKSHLAREFLRAGPRFDTATLHRTAAALAAELDEALAARCPGPFRESLLTAERVVLEDAAALHDRPKTQDLFLAVLDDTLARGGRVLVTGPRMPGELGGLAPRLVDRLRAGATVSVAAPGVESRSELIAHFAASRQAAVPDAVRERLAAGLDLSVRELRAAVDALADRAERDRLAVWTADLADAFLSARTAAPGTAIVDVAKATAARFGLTLAQLRAPVRTSGRTPARQCAMALSRELTGEPLARIARYFGRSNHGTVLHAVKRFTARTAEDAGYRKDVAAVRRLLS